jgi:prepilin peptidase CpaA
MSTVAALVAIALLGFAAWRDVATRTIPDRVSLGIAALGLTVRGLEGFSALTGSLLVAALLGGLLFMLHAARLVGGGDVKLLAALALLLPPFETWNMVVATALAGGALGLVYLVLRPVLRARAGSRRRDNKSLPGRVLVTEAWRIRRGGPLPYGVAIAAGGTVVLLQSIAS